MKHFSTLCIGMFFVLTTAACIGEDYDVGVPTAYLQLEIGLQDQETQLTEANVSWSSSSGDIEKTIDNIEAFGLSQDEVRVHPNQEASLDFQENEENGGDIWSDPSIRASLWKDGEKIDIELNDYREFQFPTNEGNYVLEVKFIDSADSAQYVGNIVIEKTGKVTEKEDGKLPEFTVMEMPSIKKVNSNGLDSVGFDNSYTEVCWNNCVDNNIYNYPEIHSGNVEIGDDILIDWHKMKPHPTEINLYQIDTESHEVIKKLNIKITNTPLEIKVDKKRIGTQYALEFLWKERNKVKGRSMLDFRLE